MNDIPGLYPKYDYKKDGSKKLGSWMYQPSSKGLPPGTPRPQRIRLNTTDKMEAIAKINAIRHDRLQSDRSGHIADLLLLAARDKLRDRSWSQRTFDNARSTIKIFADDLGNPAISHIHAARMKRWHTDMLETRSANSAAHHLRTIRSLFSRLVEMGYCIENPAASLGISKPRRTRREKFCTREQRDRLIDSCEDPDLRFVLFCGFHAGLRYGEIDAARPDWFQTDDRSGSGWITINNDATEGEEWDTKTDRARSIPLSAGFLDFLRSFDRKGAPYMLRPDVTRGRWRYRYDAKVPFKKHVTAQGLGWVTFHTMRHTFGSLLTIAGISEIKIIRWMGISRQTFEQHYAGLNPHDDDINV